MSGYSDNYRDQLHREFLNTWTPNGVENMQVTEENLRYQLALSRAYEARLKEINDGLAAFKKVLA